MSLLIPKMEEKELCGKSELQNRNDNLENESTSFRNKNELLLDVSQRNHESDNKKKIKEKYKPVNSDKLINSKDINRINEKNWYLYKKLGNCYSFLGNKNGDPYIIIGPNWNMYVMFAGGITIFFIFLFVKFGNYLSKINKILGVIFYLIYYISYTYTFMINPGYPKNDNDSQNGEPRNKFNYCDVCMIWTNKEKKVRHCNECDICIEGNDHHCPWTSKCVGKNNLISFYIFVGSSITVIFYGLLSFSYINSLLTEIEKKKKEK